MRWAIYNQQGNEDSLCTSSRHNFLANSSALLALKQGAGMEVGPLWDSKRVASHSTFVLISALIHHDLSVWYVPPKEQFVWLGVPVRKVGFVDLMRVSKRENSHRNRLCKFNAPCRKNEPGKLYRLHVYSSYRAKPLNESALIECRCNQSFINTGHLCELGQRWLDLSCNVPLFVGLQAPFWWLQERRGY